MTGFGADLPGQRRAKRVRPFREQEPCGVGDPARTDQFRRIPHVRRHVGDRADPLVAVAVHSLAGQADLDRPP